MSETPNFENYFYNVRRLLEEPAGLSLTKLKTESENIALSDKKTPIDLALRGRLLCLLSDYSMDEIKSLLRMGVAAALANICSPSTPFILFADVFNTKPISVCEELFSFMEETITNLKDVSLFAAGRNTLLRMCNDLLRRLSKSQNTGFCGQIQLFLTRLFPLDEKSGLNLMSNFNLDTETPYSTNPDPAAFRHQRSCEPNSEDLEEGEMPAKGTQLEVDASFYLKFWSLQDFFRMPTQCYDKSKWPTLIGSVDIVIEIFSNIRLMNPEDAEQTIKATDTKFSKYLTSEKLLDLQLMDISFRRYILVQLLLLFQYLSTPTKFKSADHVLNEEQQTWVGEKRDAIMHLLGADDKSPWNHFAAAVGGILEREIHWNKWKNDGCPSFVRSPEKSIHPPRKRRVNPLLDRSGKKIFRFGNRELDQLWNSCPDNLGACRDKRRLFKPSLSSYFRDAILELDPEEKVQEEYKSINKEEWTWRALRLLSRRCPHFYTNWNPAGKPVKEYLTVILTEKIQTEDDRRTHSVSVSTPSASQREASNGEVEASHKLSSSKRPANTSAAAHCGHSLPKKVAKSSSGSSASKHQPTTHDVSKSAKKSVNEVLAKRATTNQVVSDVKDAQPVSEDDRESKSASQSQDGETDSETEDDKELEDDGVVPVASVQDV